MKKAIMLCSGGLDSVVTAHYIKKNYDCQNTIILFFNYNQKSLMQERKYAKRCAFNLKAKFIEISLPELSKLSTSLINVKGKSNKIKKIDLKDTKKESKKWYVPSRNLLFISYALALAESDYIKTGSSSDIFLGFKCEGSDSYPDTTSDFIKRANNLAKISCSSHAKIIAPLIKKDKEDIIHLGKKLNVNFKNTFSCYAPRKARHCGICLACALRKSAFYWANIKDPTLYASN